MKWTSDGALLGAASDSEGASVIDFKADKITFRGSTPDEGKNLKFCYFLGK